MNDEAQQLQDSLDRIAAGEPAEDVLQAALHSGGGDLERLVALAVGLSEILPAHAEPAFRAGLQARLQTEIAGRSRPAPAGNPVPWLGRRWVFRLTATLLVLAVAMGTAVKASAGSLPGGALYPVKRATEEVRLALAWTLTMRAEVQLDIANRRIDELARLVGRGDHVDPVVVEVLVVAYGGLVDAAGSVGDPALRGEIAAAASAHGRVLSRLGQSSSDPAVDSARRALDAVAATLALDDAAEPAPIPTKGATAAGSPALSSATATGHQGSPAGTATQGIPDSARTTPAPLATRTRSALSAASATPSRPAAVAATETAPPRPAAEQTAVPQAPTSPPATAAPTSEPVGGGQAPAPTNPAANERATAIARMTQAAERRATGRAERATSVPTARPERTAPPNRPIETSAPPAEPTPEIGPPPEPQATP